MLSSQDQVYTYLILTGQDAWILLTVSVRVGARIKYKLMGVMVYF